MPHRDRDEYSGYEDTELGPRYVQYKNGNGDVNKVVWAIAAVLALTFMSLGGVVASKVFDMAERVARIEAQMQNLLNRP